MRAALRVFHFVARARPILILARTAAVLAALFLLALLLLATLPLAPFKGLVERQLSARIGVPVTIGRLDRAAGLSLAPVIEVANVRAAQPAWAGPGPLMTLRSARARVALVPLILGGRLRPREARLSGLTLSLVRAADGRESWRGLSGEGHGAAPSLAGLAFDDGRLRYRDLKRGRVLDARFDLDDTRGFRLAGAGRVAGRAVKLRLLGAPVKAGAAWPFRFRLVGTGLELDAQGTADRPLDLSAMSFTAHARADDLRTLDAAIEAGLFGTQPIDLTARIRRDGADWRLADLRGTVGASTLAAALTITRPGGRTRIEGRVEAAPFDFADLATNEGLAAARALEGRIGPRVIPNTPISLAKLGKLDGVLQVRLRQLRGGGSPPLSSVDAVLTLDRSLLTAAPLRIGLTRGTVSGTAKVDGRGRTVPILTLDLRARGTTLATLAGGGPLDAPAIARVKLAGQGDTIRAALARSKGTIALAAEHGSLPARLASLLGFDIGRGITTGGDERAALRCGAMRLRVEGGVGRIDPLILDTARAQTQGTGTVDLRNERLAVALTGAPKRASLLRLPGHATLSGTISDPRLLPPVKSRSVGTVFRALGSALGGRQAPLAADADCPRMIALAG